ncbi:MAG TPA: tRNA (N6-threonylcarbamoyladenosine(37)-N6)-methyltransferase TrmO [Ruminococcaceae bacterium]|nr:tRNA (N6-threonylcarbamoyladenosine(37)-N6)-methyltransferase TrmO [Oscillospiraceae bacterium]
MNKSFSIQPIAHIENDYREKFGIPRQSGIVSQQSKIVFEPEFRNEDALRGIEGYSHLWLIWQFSQAIRSEWSPTVRPPRLGGNTRMGVFASRSPFRPNSLGLSCVTLDGVKKEKENGTVLLVSGADLMNGTPIFDVKPYVPYADCKPNATDGFSVNPDAYSLSVFCPQALLERMETSKREALIETLQCDPRPSYQHDPTRIYKMSFGCYTVHFTVNGTDLTVTDITE